MLRGVEVGDHRVIAQQGWGAAMRAPGASDDDDSGARVDVRSGEVTEVELVVESHQGRITGRVLDEGGGPVPDAFVDAIRQSDSAARSTGALRFRARFGARARQPVLTDEDGRFELVGLAEQGLYTIHAERRGGGSALAEGIRAGQDVALAIEPTGVLAGAVKLAGGGFPDRFEVTAQDRSAGILESDRLFRSEGRWRLLHLPPGRYEISIEAPEGSAKAEVELPQGGEKTGLVMVLDPRVTLRGTLVDAETGEPIPGLKVEVHSFGAPVMLRMADPIKAGQRNVSDAEGRFEVARAPTGAVSVIVMSPGMAKSTYGTAWIPRRVAAEPQSQDLGRVELVAKRVEGKEVGELGYQTKQPEPDTQPEDFRVEVAVVRPGGPAQAAGLGVGDQILSVDGKDVQGVNMYRYRPLSRVNAGTTIELSVTGADGERTVRITASPAR